MDTAAQLAEYPLFDLNVKGLIPHGVEPKTLTMVLAVLSLDSQR